MAGLRMSVVICATAFLLGLLFTHWTADSLTLWKSPDTQTDARLWAAAAYYAVLARMPAWLAYIYAGVAAVGSLTILWSLRDGRAGNLMFDGGSIFLYGAAIYVYINDVLPNISTNFTFLVFPSQTPSISGSTSQHSPSASLPPFPAYLHEPTFQLASSHLVCSVMLTGVILLQAGRWWAEQADEDGDDDDAMVEDGEEPTTTREGTPTPPESKKTR
ncbi:Shr3 amino acid permease chaperone [Rhodofomes roseus]|uniref:Shr3 amino acid permease chaperone n=1 Tax=Rhodofomes roseus TaxID=34475 RepID=A0ABQ8KW83_9APHY|nr:Shr3 amino acid permease chaperone [Rhodofomes roseus]KAH9842560.1 Shr3 amino acid permease chaperone [Rhodofomes roseus]